MKKSNKKSTIPKKFVARDFSYDHAIEPEQIGYTEDKPLDYEDLSLNNLFSNLKNHLAKQSSMFLFLRSRENRKIELEIEHQETLTRSIEAFTKTHESSLKLKATRLFSERAIELLIEGKEVEYKLAIEQNTTLIQKQITERKLSKLSIKEKKQTLELNKLKEMAHIKLLNAKVKEQEQIANFIEEQVKELKLLPAKYRAYEFAQIINRFKQVVEDKPDIDFIEFVENYMKKKYEEDLKQTEAETKEKQSKAEYEKNKNDRKMGKI